MYDKRDFCRQVDTISAVDEIWKFRDVLNHVGYFIRTNNTLKQQNKSSFNIS